MYALGIIFYEMWAQFSTGMEVCVCVLERGRVETDTETDKGTYRGTDRETERRSDRETEQQRERETERTRDSETEREKSTNL